MSRLAGVRPDRWGLLLARAAGLVAYALLAITSAGPARRWPTVAVVAVTVAGGVYGWRWPREQWRRRLLGVATIGAGGIALLALNPDSPGWVACLIAISSGVARLPLRVGLGFALAVMAGLSGLAVALGHPSQAVSLAGAAASFALLGMILGGARERAEAAERLLASERAAGEATAQAQVYAERQRLAREIHDILAHTLSAQVVQLEGARLLLARGAPEEAVLAQIEQAQRLARDGLQETRRAVHSLRGEAQPLPRALQALSDAAGARLVVTGPPRPVEPETGLSLERTVREALTNARKHAPGASVTVTLCFRPDGVAVEVLDTGATDGRSTLAASGGGYGLAGMRERAELIGGELTAGPHPVGADGKGYRVWLKIPT